MSHQLKLDIYAFSIKPRNEKDAQFQQFNEFFRASFLQDGEDPFGIAKKEFYRRFIGSYFDFFHDEFALNQKETKGIYTEDLRPHPSSSYLDGIIMGGLTGIKQSIFKRKKPKKSVGDIGPDNVTTLPYYIKVWTPFDGTVGVIMIQGYTDAGISSLAIDHIRKFFASNDWTMERHKHVPEEYKEKFKKRSTIKTIKFLKQSLGSKTRTSFNPAFTSEDGMKVELKLSNLSLSPSKLYQFFTKNKKIIHADLSALEMVKEDDFETIAVYTDEYGRQSTASIEKDFNILPTYYLTSAVKAEGSEFPDYEKIRKHTDAILKTVSTEIGYSSKN